MATITEDYVSFEVAKLLKEKGFDVPTRTFYNPKKSHLLKLDPCLINRNAGVQVSAPTHQMTIKWLREEKGIAIIPTISSILDEEKFLWDVEIVTTKNKTYRQGWVYEHQEEAINTAIRWSLENLITN